MTKDTLANARLHFSVHPHFKTAFEWLAQNVGADFPEGKTLICDGGFTLNCQCYETHPLDSRKFETHDKFIDIQYVVAGAENIFLGDPAAMETAVEYDAEKDIRFLAGCGSPVTLSAGEFMIIWPHEAHAPGCDAPAGKSSSVRKVIVKIPTA